MKDIHNDHLPSTNFTLKTTQVTCNTLPNQQVKQFMGHSSSPVKFVGQQNKIQFGNQNNIYSITNQIQQQNIDTNSQQYSYLNDDAILEQYQKLDFKNSQGQSFTISNKSDLETTLKRNNSPSLMTPQYQLRISQLEKELNMQKQKYVDLFQNIFSKNENVKQQQVQQGQQIKLDQPYSQNMNNQKENQIDIQNQIQEQLKRTNETNKELLQKYQMLLKENEQLKQHIQTLESKNQKTQYSSYSPVLRQTQIRDDIRKEIEEKLISKHKQEMNMIITKFSREKAQMIKTVELQRLRILDNERIMLQMEGDLDGIRDSHPVSNKIQIISQKFDKGQFEIPEEQTLNRSDQSDRVVENSQRKQYNQKQLLSPSNQSTHQQNKTLYQNQRKNKSYENFQNVKQTLPTANNISHTNTNIGNQSHSITQIPSSQASSGRTHHQRFSSISTPQSVAASDLYCNLSVPNQYEFYSPEKNYHLGQKQQKSQSSASKQLNQSQTTNITSKSNSKQQINSYQPTQVSHQKMNSLNNGILSNDIKISQNSQQSQKSGQTYPYQQQNNINPNSIQFSQQLYHQNQQGGLKSSQNSQNRGSELIQNDYELFETLNAHDQKLQSAINQQNSNQLNHSQTSNRISNLSQPSQMKSQAEHAQQSNTKATPLIYNSDQSLQIYNRFKNGYDSINQLQ